MRRQSSNTPSSGAQDITCIHKLLFFKKSLPGHYFLSVSPNSSCTQTSSHPEHRQSVRTGPYPPAFNSLKVRSHKNTYTAPEAQIHPARAAWEEVHPPAGSSGVRPLPLQLHVDKNSFTPDVLSPHQLPFQTPESRMSFWKPAIKNPQPGLPAALPAAPCTVRAGWRRSQQAAQTCLYYPGRAKNWRFISFYSPGDWGNASCAPFLPDSTGQLNPILSL